MENELNFDMLDDDFALIDNEDIIPQEIEDEEKANEAKGPEKVVGEDEDSGEESTKGGDESLPNLYSSLAKALGEEGFLPGLENYTDIDSFDKLGDQIKEANKKTLADALGFNIDNVGELNSTQKEYLKALNEGIPAETFIEAKRQEYDINAITDEAIEADEELRKNIIINAYTVKGVSPEKAAKLAQMHIDLAEDVDEAKSSRDELKSAIIARNQQEFDYQKQLTADRAKTQKEYEDSLRKSFYDTDKIGKTYDITKQLKDRMYDAIVKPVAKLEDGTLVNAITKYQVENPIDFQHKLAWIFSITDGFKDFDSFVSTKAKSAATRELESRLNSTNFDKLGNVSNPGHDEAAGYGISDYKFDEEA
jgi:predicted HTH domain antitoxin